MCINFVYCFGSFAQYVDNYVDNLWKYKIDVDNFYYNDDITIFCVIVLLY